MYLINELSTPFTEGDSRGLLLQGGGTDYDINCITFLKYVKFLPGIILKLPI